MGCVEGERGGRAGRASTLGQMAESSLLFAQYYFRQSFGTSDLGESCLGVIICICWLVVHEYSLTYLG